MTEAQKILEHHRRQVEDRLPPYSEQAEAAVLSCVLQSPEETMNRLAEKRVTPEWFYDLRHQVVFNAMNSLHSIRDVPVDIISLGQYLKDAGKLEEVGGVLFLNTVEDAAPSEANLSYWLDIVREKFVLRRVIATATNLVGKSYEHQGRVDALLGDAEHDLELLSALLLQRREKHIKDVLVEEVLPEVEEHYKRGTQKLRGLSTGWTYMDKVLRGIRPDDYVVIAGRPGDGKTSLAMNIVEAVAVTGQAVGVFTMEMTDDSLASRLLYKVADVDSGGWEEGYAWRDDFDKLAAAAAKLGRQNIWLDDETDQTISMIAAKARRMANEHDIKLFVLDYLQLLDDESTRSNDRVQALRRISKKIVSMKKKMRIPWLVLAQMNRNIETAEVRRRPILSDIKESGSIEQDADKVLMIYPPTPKEMEHKPRDENGRPIRDEETGKPKVIMHDAMIREVMIRRRITKKDDWPRRMNVVVAKHRNGPTGAVQMIFQNNRCEFKDWTDWARANGVMEYGKGDRAGANPEETQ